MRFLSELLRTPLEGEMPGRAEGGAKRLLPSGRRQHTERAFERHGFRFRLAEPKDDAAIACLLNHNAIPGWITLSYRTQPGFHRPLWSEVESGSVIGTRLSDGTPGGMATRSVHPGFLQRRPVKIGWLGQLRIAKEFRNRAHLLRGGFEAVRTFLHDPAETSWYLASIITGNEPARRILEAGLHGFPHFEPLFDFHTLAFSTAVASRRFPPDIRTGEARDMPAVAAFLDQENMGRDFTPRLGEAANFPEDWQGLHPADFLLHETGGTLNGVAAVWSQQPFHSLLVRGYRAPLGRLRALVNLFAPLTGLPRLPAPGAALEQAYLALPAVAGDEPEVWQALRGAALTLARRKGAAVLAAGFAEGDPAAAILAERRRHNRYGSTIYKVFWEDERAAAETLAFSRPKLEIGLL